MHKFNVWSTVLAMAAAAVLGWLVMDWQTASASSIGQIAYNLVQNMGTPLARRTTVNFTGAGVTASDIAGVTTVTIPGGGTGGVGNAVVNITPVTASANTTSDQPLMELSLTAGYLNSASQPFLFNAAGIYTTAALQVPTLTFKVKLCTVSGCGSGTVVTLISIVSTATLAGSTNNPWNFTMMGYTATTGATGNLEIHGPLSSDLGALPGSAAAVFNDTNTAVSGNIDLTAALFLDFTAATSSGNAGNTITQRAGAIMPFGATAAPVTSVQGLTGAVTVTDANLSTSDVTTNNCSTSKHGFAPKAPNDATKFLNGLCAYATPASPRQITLVVGSSDITSTGTKACSTVENAGTITGVHLISNALPTGANLTVNVLKVAFASYTGFASAASITASATPIITTGASNPRYSDTTLTGWTTAIAAADVVCVAVNSAPTGGATYASLTLDIVN